MRVGVRVGVRVRGRCRGRGGHLVEGLAQLALDDLALLVAAVDLAQDDLVRGRGRDRVGVGVGVGVRGRARARGEDDLVVVGDAHDGRGQVAVGAEVAHVGLDRRLPGLLARDFRAREQAEGERRLAVVGDAWSG